jgi:hypothetical protein
MHMFDPLCEIPSDLPGINPATNDRMILYYCLMTKVEWFRRSYGIFLGGLSQVLLSHRAYLEKNSNIVCSSRKILS